MKSRTWFLVAVLAILAIGSGLFFWQSMSQAMNKEGLFYVEQAETLLSSWEGAPSDQRDEIEESLNLKMKELNSLKFKGEGQARWLLLKGRYELLVLNNPDLALESFSAISPRYYQRDPALLYLAFIWEEKGDLEKALAAYGDLAKSKDSLFRAQGVFYGAVLREKRGETDLAKSLYASLVADYPEMIWGQLSKNRLLYLEIEG